MLHPIARTGLLASPTAPILHSPPVNHPIIGRLTKSSEHPLLIEAPLVWALTCFFLNFVVFEISALVGYIVRQGYMPFYVYFYLYMHLYIYVHVYIYICIDTYVHLYVEEDSRLGVHAQGPWVWSMESRFLRFRPCVRSASPWASLWWAQRWRSSATAEAWSLVAVSFAGVIVRRALPFGV